MGTRIANLPVVRVVDGDTIRVSVQGQEEALRLACVDTEESQPGASKPVTAVGRATATMAKAYFAAGAGGPALVDLEFDTDDPVAVCLERHRDNYGRLLCSVHKGGEHYNLKLVREGWSPYFVKYGRSRPHHAALTAAEAEAQAAGRGIWDPLRDGGRPPRPYATLLPWWAQRAALVEDYRRAGQPAGALDVRLDYPDLVAAAATGRAVSVFCDLQGGINRWTGGAAVIYAGSVFHKFNLWIPDASAAAQAGLLALIERRYVGADLGLAGENPRTGRGYVYITGRVTSFGNKPQIELRDRGQVTDLPPAPPA